MKSDEDDVLNDSDMEQGIMGTVTAAQAEQHDTSVMEIIYRAEVWRCTDG